MKVYIEFRLPEPLELLEEVTLTFRDSAGEVAWTGGLGLLVGAVIGMMFLVRLHAALWAEQGAELSLPWGSALSVLLGGMVLVSAAVFGPIRSATRIPPAEALRSLE